MDDQSVTECVDMSDEGYGNVVVDSHGNIISMDRKGSIPLEFDVGANSREYFEELKSILSGFGFEVSYCIWEESLVDALTEVPKINIRCFGQHLLYAHFSAI